MSKMFKIGSPTPWITLQDFCSSPLGIRCKSCNFECQFLTTGDDPHKSNQRSSAPRSENRPQLSKIISLVGNFNKWRWSEPLPCAGLSTCPVFSTCPVLGLLPDFLDYNIIFCKPHHLFANNITFSYNLRITGFILTFYQKEILKEILYNSRLSVPKVEPGFLPVL